MNFIDVCFGLITGALVGLVLGVLIYLILRQELGGR